MLEAVIGLGGAIIGGIVTYLGEWWLRRDRKIRRHKASLIKLQFTLVHIINEAALLKKNYDSYKEKEFRGISPPIFGTSVTWNLDRDLLFDVYDRGTKAEKEIIVECSFLDKEFRGLLGAIEDKMKYYDSFKIDDYKMEKKDVSKSILKIMDELTNSIYRRIDEVVNNSKNLFAKLKEHIDLLYPKLAVDCIIENEDEADKKSPQNK